MCPFQKYNVDNKDELCELFTNILTKKNGDGNFFVRKDYLELVMVVGELPGGHEVCGPRDVTLSPLYGLGFQRLLDLGLESPSGGQGEMFLQKG